MLLVLGVNLPFLGEMYSAIAGRNGRTERRTKSCSFHCSVVQNIGVIDRPRRSDHLLLLSDTTVFISFIFISFVLRGTSSDTGTNGTVSQVVFV